MSAPEPISFVLDHAVPLAIRRARGPGLGYYEERARTPMAVRGVAPGSMRPVMAIPGIRDGLLACEGSLWRTVRKPRIREGGWADLPLDDALAKLGEPTVPCGYDVNHSIAGLDIPPRRPVIPEALLAAKSRQRAGLRPRAVAASDVEAALPAAVAIARSWVAANLLHDGERLYVRQRPPMVAIHDLSRASELALWDMPKAPPVLHTRLEADGAIPHVHSTDFVRTQAPRLAGTLARALDGIDLADADVRAFAEHVPGVVVLSLRARPERDPGGRLDAALWPHVLAGGMGGMAAGDETGAVDAIVRACAALFEGVPRYSQDRALRNVSDFALRVARPAIGARSIVLAEDLDGLDGLAP